MVLVGAKVPEWNSNARYGTGKYFILEADEFNNNFLYYHPDIAIINNIEFDHPDFFKNKSDVEKSFKKFIGNLKGEKVLITEKDSPNKTFNLKVMGEHNQKNANMVYVLGKKLGIPEYVIINSLESFRGVERRMELIKDKNGIKIFDDYAHHPTAIKTTLEGVRKVFPKAKILAVVEPHGYKRTQALLAEYRGVFDSVNKVIIGPIFQARDEIDESLTPQKVAQASRHKDAVGLNSFEEITKKYKLLINNYGVIVVMGAGKSYLWAREIAKLIK
jgi:UDP-N-acetylmuramate--alanine ligase